jgi:restriction system protein
MISKRVYIDEIKNSLLETYKMIFNDLDYLNFGYLGGYQDIVLKEFDIIYNNLIISQITYKITELFKFDFDYFYDSFFYYNTETRLLSIELYVPDIFILSDIYEERIIKGKVSITKINEKSKKETYDYLMFMYSIILPKAIFETILGKYVDSITLNLLTKKRSDINGNIEDKLFLSLIVNYSQLKDINLDYIDPKKTFKYLKGISASKLYEAIPIEPIISFDKGDKRLKREQANYKYELNTENLAEMDWQDFEDLIRNLFEREFSDSESDVRVTRATRDGGVDAIIFNPDPIKGGKIIIQAKRYTNTVDLSSVRDLYGTLLNEGATKAILVTTSDYGKDSYEFIKGKPITLLNGSNLLFLLKKNGMHFKIDIQKAKEQFKYNNGV